MALIGLTALLVVCQPRHGLHAGPLPAGSAVSDDLLRDVLKVPAAADVSEESRHRLQLAVDGFREQRFDDCLQHLSEAAAAWKSLPPAPLMLARLFFASGQIPQGRLALEQAAVAAPDDPEVSLAFGDLALFDGHLADARLHFLHAAGLSPRDQRDPRAPQKLQSLVEAGLATVAERRLDWAAAADALVRWLELEPDDLQARRRLGQVRFQQQDYDAAFKELESAAAGDLEGEPPSLSMGLLFHRSGQQGLANEWMERALRDHAGDLRVQFAVAQWCVETDQLHRAERHLEQAAELDRDRSQAPPAPADGISAELVRLRGMIARQRGDYEGAERHFQALVQEQPADFPAANQLALVLIEQVDDAKRRRALQLAEVNARQYPDAPEALSTLGWIQHRLGQSEAAERTLRTAVSGGRATSETAYYLAVVLQERGRNEEAEPLLSGAVAATGPFPFRDDANRRLERLQATKVTE